MAPNKIGEIICDCWGKIDQIYYNVKTDAFCLMPNHIHGIIVISDKDGQGLQEGGQSRPPLHRIIQGFKSVTTRMCFKYNYKSIWQRNYYEHIIRNEQEYTKIYEYIETNAIKWREDKYYI